MNLKSAPLRPSRLTSLIVLTAFLWGVVTGGTPVSKASEEIADRYLLVVDTSSPMKRCSKAMIQVVTDLVNSGMQGELKKGDELGIWTYDKELHTGDIPIQRWVEKDKAQIRDRTVAFLNSRKYANKTRFEQVLPVLRSVAEESHRLTVIVISDGDESFAGTAFAKDIAEYYEQHRKQMYKMRVPFVLVVRAVDGELVDFDLSYPPWPIEFPAFPPEPKPEPEPVVEPVVAASSSAEVVSHTRPLKVVEPLIISGQKKDVQPAGVLLGINPVTNTLASGQDLARSPSSVEDRALVTTTVSKSVPEAHQPPVAVPLEQRMEVPGDSNTLVGAAVQDAGGEPPPTPASVANPEPAPPEAPRPARPDAPLPTQSDGTGTSWLLVSVIVVLSVALAWNVVALRRSRARGRQSLITRSMDAEYRIPDA